MMEMMMMMLMTKSGKLNVFSSSKDVNKMSFRKLVNLNNWHLTKTNKANFSVNSFIFH